jgi:hypothetical protein
VDVLFTTLRVISITRLNSGTDLSFQHQIHFSLLLLHDNAAYDLLRPNFNWRRHFTALTFVDLSRFLMPRSFLSLLPTAILKPLLASPSAGIPLQAEIGRFLLPLLAILASFRLYFRRRIDLPLFPASEFDTAAYVLLCTDPCPNGTRRQQWVFLTDGSFEGDCYGTLEDGIQPEPEPLPMILALDINLPEESFVPVEKSLVGSVVVVANVRRQARDEQHRFGRGAASDVTVVSGNLNGSYLRHLKGKAEAVLKWGEASPEVGLRLRLVP